LRDQCANFYYNDRRYFSTGFPFADSFIKMESTLDIDCATGYTPLMESLLSVRSVNALNNRLEEIRKQRGIKQEELAAALEVSRQTIGSLENGRYNPSILLAFKIARFFGMTIEEIFIYEEDEHV
jgi:putative transcriptional regulator